MFVSPLEKKRVFLFLIFLIAIGSFLRFYNLGHIFLWGDDPLHQVRIAYQPLWFVIAHNNQTALSTLLAHFLLPLGKIEFMARLGSALCGVMAICIIYLLGQALFAHREGLIAAIFVTFSPFLIHFSQYSRAYSLFALLSLLSLYFFSKAIKENKPHFWISYSLFMVLGIYNHLVALLIVPALTLFTGILWLGEWLNQKIGSPRKAGNVPLTRFFLWTFLALLVAAFLYLPNTDVRDFLMGSLKRTVAPRENVSRSYLLINNILRDQLSPQTPFFYWMSLLLVGVGVIGSLKKYKQEILLFSSYVIIPYLIFVSLNPRPTNLFSADRFFIFVLPAVFLLVARGIAVANGLFSSVFRSRKFARASPHWLRQVPCFIVLLIMLGGYAANFRIHYLQHWRFGSFGLNKEEIDFFKRHLKKDAVLHLDMFPLSSTIIIVSPLEKGLKLEETEFIIRDGLNIQNKETDFMVYQIDWDIFEIFVASRNADLWMISELDDRSYHHLQSAVQDRPGINVYPLQRYTLLHFSQKDESIAQKMAQISEIFLTLPLGKLKEKQFRWLAAKTSLMVDGIEEFSRQFQAAQSIEVKPEEIRAENLSAVIRVFDKLFGLKPERLLEIYQEKIFTQIQSLLFLFGNNSLARGEVESAARAYRECLQVGDDFLEEIEEKIPILKENFVNLEQNSETLSLFIKILTLDPHRYDLRMFLSEAYRKSGNLAQAEAEFKAAFGMPSLPPDFFSHIAQLPQSLIIWEKESRCFLLIFTQESSIVSGKIRANKKIFDPEKVGFSGEDSLASSKNRIRFQLNAKKGQVKWISFRISDNTSLNFDLKVDGIRDPRRVIFLPSGDRPTQIPFDRDYSASK